MITAIIAVLNFVNFAENASGFFMQKFCQQLIARKDKLFYSIFRNEIYMFLV